LLNAQNHHIWADPIRIQQVFWNLINNAVKFTPAGGKIEIATSNMGGDLLLEVRDNGIGIDAKHQKVLFNPFEQGDRSVTRQFGGLGLGLAISKLLMDLHDGRIEVESGGRSQGATFRVSMALAAAELGSKTAETRVAPKTTRSLRILLVEDHVDTRRTLSRLLRHFGHKISVADSRETARHFIDLDDFDVVLSDIGLPDGTGYDVISQAKAKKQHRVLGVALTGFGSDEDIRRGKEAGFDYHLTKPVDFHELRTVLDRA
jgi:CheY-like chemotaxis protein/anti-sigma regulatory factor (Ser/Thr protein kinase)